MPGFRRGLPGLFPLKDNFLPCPQVDTLVIDLGQPFGETCINLASRSYRSKDELWGWSFNEAYLKGAEISAPIRGAANHQNREVIRMARDIVEQGSSGTPMLNLRGHCYAGLTYWAKNADALVIPADAFEEHFPGVFEEKPKTPPGDGLLARALEEITSSDAPPNLLTWGFVSNPNRPFCAAVANLSVSGTFKPSKPLVNNRLGIDKQILAETFQFYVAPSDYVFEGRAQLARKMAPKKRRALADKWSKDLTALFLEGFLHQKNSYVLLLGDAGVGKTTFLQKVFCDYARKYPPWPWLLCMREKIPPPASKPFRIRATPSFPSMPSTKTR
ncbi:MAG: hypothetical protein IPJ40_10510 [Saprospirales bacterium]|nr:hypothetical protein [Saprospirales bacterium]